MRFDWAKYSMTFFRTAGQRTITAVEQLTEKGLVDRMVKKGKSAEWGMHEFDAAAACRSTTTARTLTPGCPRSVRT